ncbi:MAG: hypothetical protein DWQ11_07200 [Proteobacteria bacterium]|nr:MAG: hypothetical protein DWQ11_07200 [Pseudomonadota bacterium]
MLNLNYAAVSRAYRRFAALTDTDLFEALGWAACIGAPGYRRTDALHLSLALLSCKAPLTGPLSVLAGPLAGGRADGASNRLAEWLLQRHGAPERLPAVIESAAEALFGRRGIVAFMQHAGPDGGRIALFDGRDPFAMCRRATTCHPYEIRFWPLA